MKMWQKPCTLRYSVVVVVVVVVAVVAVYKHLILFLIHYECGSMNTSNLLPTIAIYIYIYIYMIYDNDIYIYIMFTYSRMCSTSCM